MDTYATIFADYISGLSFEDLPRNVVEDAKYRILDIIGVALPAYAREGAVQVMVDFIREVAGRSESTILVMGDKVPAHNAAMINGLMAHCLELDDDHNVMIGHPGSPVIPACLAVAEREGASGRSLIVGVVAGYEGVVRTSVAVNAFKPGVLHNKGFHPTGTNGIFGAVVGAGRIMKLGGEKIANALGIAGGFSAGLLQGLYEGAWTKRLNPGWAAHSGVIASDLARLGYSGPKGIFEGSHGWFNAYAGEGNYDLEIITKGLGDSFSNVETSYKPYACCRYCHSPIDALLEIMKEHTIEPEKVESITVRTFKEAIHITVDPPERRKKPQTVVDAQFSMHYAIAVSLLTGRALLDEFSEEMIGDPIVLDLASRVDVVLDDEMEKAYPKLYPAGVMIRMKSGEEFYHQVKTAKGDPQWPLTAEELVERFHILASPVIGHDRASAVVENIQNLESIEDVGSLMTLLVAGK